MGLLERAHSFKDKTARGLAANVGLFTYPVLMAADILLFDTTHVPVGRDQKQHVEMTRDMAIKFNLTYGETFVVPESVIRDESAVVPGLDGQKMSKSYGNTLELFGEEKAVRKKIMGIPMDSRTPAEPKRDADQNLAVRLLKLVAAPELARETEEKLRAGGLGYGDLKKVLFEQYWSHFAAARARRAELSADPGHVDAVLREGAERARAVAGPVLARARKACGLR
jgi:tryptophanyl-tRNA synthetase